MMFKRISIVLIIILTIALACLLMFAKKTEVSTDSVDAYNSQISVLENEKHLLMDEYSKLDDEYSDLIVGKGTVNLLFTDFDSLITSNVFPLLNKYGFCGQLMINKEQYPDAEGCMTRSEFDSLLLAGWEYVLDYDGKENFEIWLSSIDELVKGMNFSRVSTTIYFNEGTYKPEYDGIALNYGYNILIHHGENGDPIITEGVSENGTTWRIGAITAFYSKHTSKLNETNACGGNIAMTLGTRSDKEIFTDEMLQSLILQLNNMILDGSTYQMSTTNAYKYKSEVAEKSEKYSIELAEKKALLQSQIDEIVAEINTLKQKYFEENNVELTINTSAVSDTAVPETEPVQTVSDND